MSKPNQSSRPPAVLPPEQRRGFFTQAAAIVIGGIVGIFPVLAGLLVFFDPTRRKSGEGKWIRVATFDSLPDDGVPRYFPVIMEKRDDAWTRFLNEPVGAVYLIREPGKDDVTAFTATCPHAGCMVSYLAEEGKGYFQCPCHTSAFNIKGERMLDISNVPPRDMDMLECKVETTKSGSQEIRIKFQDFYTGRHEKVAKA